MKPLDIGERIRQEVENQHWNFSDFARAINCSRSSLYHIFNSSDISLGRLIIIGKVLNHDFISEICSNYSINYLHRPFIAIPFNGEQVDLSGIPDNILKMIKSQLDE